MYIKLPPQSGTINGGTTNPPRNGGLIMQKLQQKTKTVKAFIYRLIDGERLLVDVRNITGWSMERVARFAKDMDCCGRDYEVIAS